LLPVYAVRFLLKMSGFRAFARSSFGPSIGGSTDGRGLDMPIYFDLRLLLLVPAFVAVAFMVWVFLNLAKDIGRHRRQYAGFNSRRRDKSQFWE
jgi:hypothetical protein